MIVLNIFLVYESHAHTIESAIKKSWHLLQMMKNMASFLKNDHCFFYKKGKAIGNHLVRSDLISKKNPRWELNKPTRKRGTYPCNNCQNCRTFGVGKVNIEQGDSKYGKTSVARHFFEKNLYPCTCQQMTSFAYESTAADAIVSHLTHQRFAACALTRITHTRL